MYCSIGAPLGLVGSSEGSRRPSKPNQDPQRTGNTVPFFVMRPVGSTRNTAPPEARRPRGRDRRRGVTRRSCREGRRCCARSRSGGESHIDAGAPDGKIVASREHFKTEREIAAIKPQDSITLAELKELAGRQTGYPWAESVLRKFEAAQNLPARASKEEALAKAQDMADLMARRGPYALHSKTSDQTSIDLTMQKSQEALAALQNSSDEQVLIASNLTPASPNLQSGEVPNTLSDATNAAAPDATLAQGAALDYCTETSSAEKCRRLAQNVRVDEMRQTTKNFSKCS